MPATLIRGVRLVPVGSAADSAAPVDLRIRAGRIVELAPTLRPRADELVVAAAGRWAIPGLWDQHVHLTQWARWRQYLDLSNAGDAGEVVRRVAEQVGQLPASRAGSVLVGAGYRSALWPEPPSVELLDRVSGDHPVILISGDCHNGWLNSRALQLAGLAPRTTALAENDWFTVFARLGELTGTVPAAAFGDAVSAAAQRGVVGVVDLELAGGYRDWPERFAAGVDALRIRPGVYPDRLAEVVAAGLRTGDELGRSAGLLTLGPLKIISDGSLNTRTACCDEPYRDARGSESPRGKLNFTLAEQVELLTSARRHGLTVAVHAIGDAALGTALDAFARTGARGGIEHAQLVRRSDLTRMAQLGVRASVQPAHLLDDRDVTLRCWPDRADRCFAFRSMLRAGVTVVFGSDAPVAPLNPWLAMTAAVHRSADEREPWNPAEALTAAEALAASTDGQPTLSVGSRGDVVLLDQDPLASVGDTAAVSRHLRGIGVAATFVAGRPTHLAI